MKVHLISRTPWHEPHRIRQQLACLLSHDYPVVYHQPNIMLNDEPLSGSAEVELKRFFMIQRFMSLPLITFINFIILRVYIWRRVGAGDVIINFLPELLAFGGFQNRNVISLFNDDFASMAPRYSAWWIKKIMCNMARRSKHCLYVSKRLMQRYPSAGMTLFYPWSDRLLPAERGAKNIILYWGYISIAMDFDKIREITRQLEREGLEMEVWLVGPVAAEVEGELALLVSEYDRIKVLGPSHLQDLPLERVVFGVELISPRFGNGHMVEMPNKAPRLLSYGIPLVFSGCNIVQSPFFVKYEGDITTIIKDITLNSDFLQDQITQFFIENDSSARLKTVSQIISSIMYPRCDERNNV